MAARRSSQPYFLVLAPEDDVHAQAVIREAMELGSSKSSIIDFAETAQQKVSWDGESLSVNGSKWDTDIGGASAIWWRRVLRPKLNLPDYETKQYCETEYHRFLESILAPLEYRGIILNNRQSRYFGNAKIQQLNRARNCGLRVPRTCITNDCEVAQQFILSVKGEVIAKGFGGTRERYSPTQLIRESDLTKLRSLRLSPVIFQERIKRSADYRLTIVEDTVFCARVQADFSGADIDWRVDFAATCRPDRLSADIEHAVLSLKRDLGLFFCTIDLIESADDGEIYFLEVNECGQFLFVEVDTGLPISRTIASSLLSLESP